MKLNIVQNCHSTEATIQIDLNDYLKFLEGDDTQLSQIRENVKKARLFFELNKFEEYKSFKKSLPLIMAHINVEKYRKDTNFTFTNLMFIEFDNYKFENGEPYLTENDKKRIEEYFISKPYLVWANKSLSERIFLTEALNRTIAFKRSYVAPRSFENIKLMTNLLIEWLKKNDIVDLEADSFNRYHALKFFEDEIISKGHKPRTINGYLSYLKLIFQHVCKIIDVEKNPFERIEKVRVKESEIHIWTEEYQKQLVEFLKKEQPEMFIIVLFVFQCFLRPNEIRQIQIKDISIEKSLIHISSRKGKSNRTKNPTLSQQLISLLSPICENPNKELYLFSKDLKPGTKLLSRSTISGIFKRLRRQLKLPDELKLYNFKHTGNSMMLDIGASIQELKEQNGHSETRTTEIYARKLYTKANLLFKYKVPEL